MNNYYVIYNANDVIWCYRDEAFEKMASGFWNLFGIADSEQSADIMAEEACY